MNLIEENTCHTTMNDIDTKTILTSKKKQLSFKFVSQRSRIIYITKFSVMKNLIGHKAMRSKKVQDRKTAAIEPRVFFKENETLNTLGPKSQESKQRKAIERTAAI